MDLEFFIAKRLITAKSYKSSISSPIIKIAITAIAIGIIMMIMAVATGVGLQDKIREKVSAFNGHIIISNFDDNQSQVTTEPISINQSFYPKFKNVEGREKIKMYCQNYHAITCFVQTAKEKEKKKYIGIHLSTDSCTCYES